MTKRVTLNIGLNIGDRVDALSPTEALRHVAALWHNPPNLSHLIVAYPDRRERTLVVEFDQQWQDNYRRTAILAARCQQDVVAVKRSSSTTGALVRPDGGTRGGWDNALFLTLEQAEAMYSSPQKPEGTAGGPPVDSVGVFIERITAALKPKDYDADIKRITDSVTKLAGVRERGDTNLHKEFVTLASAHNKLVDRVAALERALCTADDINTKRILKLETKNDELVRRINGLETVQSSNISAEWVRAYVKSFVTEAYGAPSGQARQPGWMAGAGSSSPLRDAEKATAPIKDGDNKTVTLTHDEWGFVLGCLLASTVSKPRTPPSPMAVGNWKRVYGVLRKQF